MPSLQNKESRKTEIEILNTQRAKVKEQEELALRVGKSFLRQGNQQRATEFFTRANVLFSKRDELEKQILALCGITIPITEASFAHPVLL